MKLLFETAIIPRGLETNIAKFVHTSMNTSECIWEMGLSLDVTFTWDKMHGRAIQWSTSTVGQKLWLPYTLLGKLLIPLLHALNSGAKKHLLMVVSSSHTWYRMRQSVLHRGIKNCWTGTELMQAKFGVP